MSKAYKYLSEEVKALDVDGTLATLWEDIYNNRLEKTGSKRKAVSSASSTVYSECLKQFKIDEDISLSGKADVKLIIKEIKGLLPLMDKALETLKLTKKTKEQINRSHTRYDSILNKKVKPTNTDYTMVVNNKMTIEKMLDNDKLKKGNR